MDSMLRKTYRAQLTKLVKTANERIQNGSQTDVKDIPVLIERIKAVQQSLRELNIKIAPTVTENEMEEACEKIIEYDDAAVEIIARLNEYKRQLLVEREGKSCSVINQSLVESARAEDSSDTVSVEENRSLDESIHFSHRNTFVKLPKLELIRFGGEIDQWPAFWEQYSAAIHNNSSLSEAAKYAYLKSILYGRAAITISGLTSGQASYDDAIDILKTEYGNTERIVDKYVLKLTSLPPVKSEKDIDGLRKLYNSTTTATKSLITLGIEVEQYGLLVKSTVYNALPYGLKVQYNKAKLNHLKKDENTDYGKQISDLVEFIKIEIEANEQARNVTRDHERPTSTSGKQPFTAAGLLLNTKGFCLFCKGRSHFTSDCRSNIAINDKKNILRQNKRCFRCTRGGHNAKTCNTRFQWCSKCKGKHVTSMCDPNYTRSNSTITPNESKPLSTTTTAVANLSSAHRKTAIHLQTGLAFIRAASDTPIRLVFDGGSHLTFIKRTIVDNLQLPKVDTIKFSVACFGGTERSTPKWHNIVEIKLKSPFNENVTVIRAVVVDEICSEPLTAFLEDVPAVKEFAVNHQMADVNMKQLGVSNELGMLIGADNYWKLVTGEIKRVTDNLMALNTKLGWTLLGDSNAKSIDNPGNAKFNSMLCLQSDHDYDIRKFWDLETIGITANEKSENIMETFINEKIIYKNKKYEVSLPWDSTDNIDSNYNVAFAHLQNLVNKLSRHGKINEYDNSIREYLTNEHAEVTAENPVSERIYYMPHRPVYREDKETTKVRVVFNASAHTTGSKSLNEILLTGDNLMPELVTILLNFRIGAIAMTADIEKAFLQISIAEKDRDALRFLWYRDPIKDSITSINELPPIQHFRMKRVTFGVTSSPFLLNATIRKHLNQQPPEFQRIADLLSKSFYVDDLILGASTFDEAREIFNYARKAMLEASMNLRKWSTNDEALRRVFCDVNMEAAGGPTRKVLGVNWHTISDELSIDIQSIVKGINLSSATKRIILQVVARIFDPLGMLVPYVVRAKLLLQSIWKADLNWDDELPIEMQIEWRKWCAEIEQLINFTMPRCIVADRAGECELHIFADASMSAFGAVAYAKPTSSSEPHFIMAKSRVAPINKKREKKLTCPQLELTAALCAVRLQDYIVGNMSLVVKNIYLWSDSKIALHWINGNSQRWSVYVKNRVVEINKRCKGEWRYCTGKQNPADMLTRGVSAKILSESEMWQRGPEWLSCDSSQWPNMEPMKDEDLSVVNCFAEVVAIDDQPSKPIFPMDRFSSIVRMHRVTAYVRRFCSYIKGDREIPSGQLTRAELRSAEVYWLKLVQATEFHREIVALKAKTSVPTDSTIIKLNPFLDDDGLLRLGSRLEESSLPYETIYPIILPKTCPYTQKVILAAHENTMHGGVNATLATIRAKFWIIKGRQRVKNITSQCVTCKKLKGKSGDEPFAPLPRNRITPVRPFQVTGVDFAGPLYVKDSNGQNKKAYIMLLTCAVIRAVHLELVVDLSSESCARAFRRFFARRGVPRTIYSDNALTFKRVSKDLTNLFNLQSNENLHNLAATHNFEWKFIVERAAWWGGFWERMVRTVKTALKITLGKLSVGFDELHTVLLEVEAIVNARPLTYIDDDPTNLEILSPADFLIMGNDMRLNITNPILQVSHDDMLEQWRLKERVCNKFWRIWSQQYLQQLRTAHFSKLKKSNSINKGDIVLLQDQNQPRLMWKLARVVEVYEGKDGCVRACEIRTSNGRFLRRPIQHLYPLEVDNFPAREDVENKYM